MYQMKFFLSLIMLVPCIYLDSIGKPTYKKYSFYKFKSLLKVNDEIIRKASTIRNLWPILETHPYNQKKIPKWLMNTLGNNYFKRAFYLVDRLVRHTK